MRPLGAYSLQIVPALRRSLQDQPGALVLCDSFAGQSAHGNLVAQVVSQQGFAGKLVAVPFEDTRDPDQARRNQQLGELVQGWGEASTGAAVQQNLFESILCTRLGALESASQRLLALAESGAGNLAVNLSLGSTPALCVAAVLEMCRQPESRQQALTQLALGYNLKAQALLTGDVRETAALHQALAQTAVATTADPRLVQAQEDFSAAVRDVEANRNSVVVAAGNDGNMALLCPMPEGFTRSDLVTPDTTVVGALENGLSAAYNGDARSITDFAPGAVYLPSLRETVHGTSFAAPQVAAALAGLHGRHPELSSLEVEELLQAGNIAPTPATGPASADS